MTDADQTRKELVAEIDRLKQRVEDSEHRQEENLLAEEAMWTSQIALATLMNNLPGIAYRAAYDTDGTRHVEYVSGGWSDITGHSPARLLEDPDYFRGTLTVPDDRARVRTAIASALTARTPYELEYRIQAADGTIKWLWERGTGLYDAQDRLEALEGFITDITPRKQALLELQGQLRCAHREHVALCRFQHFGRVLGDALHAISASAQEAAELSHDSDICRHLDDLLDACHGLADQAHAALSAPGAASDEASERRESPPDSAAAPLRILLLAPGTASGDATRRLLALRHHHVHWCATAAELLQTLDGAAGPWDVVLMDTAVPDTPAARMIATIRQRLPDTGLVVITGIGEDLEGAVHSGALMRPFELAALDAALRDAAG